VDISWQDAAMSDAAGTARRVLLHLQDGRRIPVEPDEVFYLEADGDETAVRTRGRRKLRDVRSLGELTARFPKGQFVLVHRSTAVNVDRVAELRRRENGRDWELRLEPPVNRVVPVARHRVPALWAAYGDSAGG
jgi:DNA-binding LytR/AlgR family response regulator